MSLDVGEVNSVYEQSPVALVEGGGREEVGGISWHRKSEGPLE